MKAKYCFMQDGIFVKTVCVLLSIYVLLSIDNSCFQILDCSQPSILSYFYLIVECVDRITRDWTRAQNIRLDLVGGRDREN